MALVDSLRKATKKAIDKFGGDVTVRIVTVGAYNTTDGTASESNSDTTIKGVLQEIKQERVSDLVEAHEKKLTIAASAVTTKPGTKDKIVISSVVYKIVRVKTIEQDNTAITYELFLKE